MFLLDKWKIIINVQNIKNSVKFPEYLAKFQEFPNQKGQNSNEISGKMVGKVMLKCTREHQIP